MMKSSASYLDSLTTTTTTPTEHETYEKVSRAPSYLDSLQRTDDDDVDDEPYMEKQIMTTSYLDSLNYNNNNNNNNYDYDASAAAVSSPFQPISTNEEIMEEEVKEDKEEKEPSKAQQLLQQIKDAGKAGVISYTLWELGFWGISLPLCVLAYKQFSGHWPNLKEEEDLKQLGTTIFAFTNVARFAVPLRIGLALSTAPWIQENLLDRFFPEEMEEEEKKWFVDESSQE